MHILICECWVLHHWHPCAEGFKPYTGIPACMGSSIFVARFFHGFLALHIFRTEKIDASHLSGFVELRFSNSPLLPLSSLTTSLATNDWVLTLLEFLSAASLTTCICLDVFFIQHCELRETLPKLREAFQQHIHCGIRPPDNVSVLQWYWECFFFRHMEFNSWVKLMTINVIPCDRPNVVSGFSVIR